MGQRGILFPYKLKHDFIDIIPQLHTQPSSERTQHHPDCLYEAPNKVPAEQCTVKDEYSPHSGFCAQAGWDCICAPGPNELNIPVM